MLSNKRKQYIRLIRTINELCDELIYLDDSQKWFVDQVTDDLRTMNRYNCKFLIDDLNKRILVRR